MSEYQLVPYTVEFAVKGAPKDRRDLNNVDASSLSARDFVARAAHAHLGTARRASDVTPRALEINGVHTGQHTVLVRLSSGRSGVEGDIARVRENKKADVDLKKHDWTRIQTRAFFYLPPHSMIGVLLLERAGGYGSVTDLRDMLQAALAHYVAPDLRIRVNPAMSPEQAKEWAAGTTVKGIRLQHINTRTGQPISKVDGIPTSLIMEFKPPRGRGWTFDKLSQGGAESVMTQLVPELPGGSGEDAAETAAKMLTDGWTVEMDLQKGKGGKRRSVNIQTQLSITLTFPAGPKGHQGAASDEQFQSACWDALQDLRLDGVPAVDASACSWDDVPWEPKAEKGKDPWKAVWGVNIS